MSAHWPDLRDGQGRVSVLWDLMTKESDHLDPLDLDMHQTCSFTLTPAKSNEPPASCNFGSVDSSKYGELSNLYADSIRSDSAHDTFLWQSRRYDSRTTIFSPEGEPCPVPFIPYVTY
jgi:hypothetical protein